MPAHVAFCTAMEGIVPLAAAQPAASELVADAGTSTASAKAGQIARVTATSDVYVAFAPASVTPSATNGHRIQSGASMDFAHLQNGWVMSVAAA